MANRRGRPTGYIMSEQSKAQIRETKTGQRPTFKTRRKISKSVKEYFKTDVGRAQINRMSEFLNDVWSSKEGVEFKKSMKNYYDTWYRNEL